MNNAAPIIVFTYNRIQETRATLTALQQNNLAEMSELFVFSDGGKDNFDQQKVTEVREYLKTINGFKRVEIFESESNQGLANSVIRGVSDILTRFDKVIVLEDDLVTTGNFLDFMNQALDFYQDCESVFSISGYTMDLARLKQHPNDFYVGQRASSWGWATWKDRWKDIDWEVSNYPSLKKRMAFYNVSSDMPGMLKKQMRGRIDSWAIRWCYHQFNRQLFTIFPTKSKVQNIGMGENATHTRGDTKFKTPLDESGQTQFNFSKHLQTDKIIINQFKAKFSVQKRLYDKLSKIIRRQFS